MVIKEEIEIEAPLTLVWRIFSRMEDWKDWNFVCQDCCYLEGSEMSEGTCFSFVMKPFNFPIKVAPRIVACEPGRKVVWEGTRFGVHAEHTFLFREKKDRVVLLSVEKFKGPLVFISRLLRVPGRLHRLTQKMLGAIKKQAEACTA
jgi:hypothetical protein